MLSDFVQFHTDNGLPLHETTHRYIDSIQDARLEFSFTKGHKRPAQYRAARKAFKESAKARVSEALQEYERELEASQCDPNFVDVPDAMPRYRAWTCGLDESLTLTHNSLYNRATDTYRISDLARINAPPSYLNAAKDGFVRNPIELYEWFEGELVSPILDYDHHDTIPSIQRACAALRDNFRIHKPTSTILSGLHIHFGQEAGWDLLTLKKFTTLWLVLEESLERLHRRDRSDATNKYTCSLRMWSPVAQELRRGQPMKFRSNIETADPATFAQNMSEMVQHVPSSTEYYRDVEKLVRNVITEVWKYTSISDLGTGMTPTLVPQVPLDPDRTTCMSFRMYGDTHSVPNDEEPCTMEIRIMQGTLDADHIAHWMRICERLIVFSRDSTPREFYNGISDLVTGSRALEEVVGIPAATMDWFRARVSQGDDGQDIYFRYPDNDEIDWSYPFMTPGYGDTYT
ncbi:hypothetical protein F4811DRAFT_564703 [Daldinia bambusicola]|nr:hypothetical protein F4811DRAFT_564703 [Daldinia bambusicola]